jgi:hypothetical protein
MALSVTRTNIGNESAEVVLANGDVGIYQASAKDREMYEQPIWNNKYLLAERCFYSTDRWGYTGNRSSCLLKSTDEMSLPPILPDYTEASVR